MQKKLHHLGNVARKIKWCCLTYRDRVVQHLSVPGRVRAAGPVLREEGGGADGGAGGQRPPLRRQRRVRLPRERTVPGEEVGSYS